MNISSTLRLYADANINQADKGSSIINIPDKLQSPKLRDVARQRLVKTNPDVDSAATKKRKRKRSLIDKVWDETINKKPNHDSQADNNAFVGKPFRVQDTSYGHLISEHDNEASAEKAATGRPYSRVIHSPEWQHSQPVRDLIRRKIVRGK